MILSNFSFYIDFYWVRVVKGWKRGGVRFIVKEDVVSYRVFKDFLYLV